MTDVDLSDDHCFTCGQDGQLILCDYPGCNCVYHQVCVIKRLPSPLEIESESLNLNIEDNLFYCPRHFCTLCGSIESKELDINKIPSYLFSPNKIINDLLIENDLTDANSSTPSSFIRCTSLQLCTKCPLSICSSCLISSKNLISFFSLKNPSLCIACDRGEGGKKDYKLEFAKILHQLFVKVAASKLAVPFLRPLLPLVDKKIDDKQINEENLKDLLSILEKIHRLEYRKVDEIIIDFISIRQNLVQKLLQYDGEKYEIDNIILSFDSLLDAMKQFIQKRIEVIEQIEENIIKNEEEMEEKERKLRRKQEEKKRKLEEENTMKLEDKPEEIDDEGKSEEKDLEKDEDEDVDEVEEKDNDKVEDKNVEKDDEQKEIIIYPYYELFWRLESHFFISPTIIKTFDFQKFLDYFINKNNNFNLLPKNEKLLINYKNSSAFVSFFYKDIVYPKYLTQWYQFLCVYPSNSFLSPPPMLFYQNLCDKSNADLKINFILNQNHSFLSNDSFSSNKIKEDINNWLDEICSQGPRKKKDKKKNIEKYERNFIKELLENEIENEKQKNNLNLKREEIDEDIDINEDIENEVILFLGKSNKRKKSSTLLLEENNLLKKSNELFHNSSSSISKIYDSSLTSCFSSSLNAEASSTTSTSSSVGSLFPFIHKVEKKNINFEEDDEKIEDNNEKELDNNDLSDEVKMKEEKRIENEIKKKILEINELKKEIAEKEIEEDEIKKHHLLLSQFNILNEKNYLHLLTQSYQREEIDDQDNIILEEIKKSIEKTKKIQEKLIDRFQFLYSPCNIDFPSSTFSNSKNDKILKSLIESNYTPIELQAIKLIINDNLLLKHRLSLFNSVVNSKEDILSNLEQNILTYKQNLNQLNE